MRKTWAFFLTTVTLGCGYVAPEGSHIDECVPHPCPYSTYAATLVDGTMSWDVGTLGAKSNVALGPSGPCTQILGGLLGPTGLSVHCQLDGEIKGSQLGVFLSALGDLRRFDSVGRIEMNGAQAGLAVSICEYRGTSCLITDTPSPRVCDPLVDDVPVIADVELVTGEARSTPKFVTEDFHRVVAFQLDTGTRPRQCGGTVAAALALRVEQRRASFTHHPDEYCSCP